jgi:subtilase family serine protease
MNNQFYELVKGIAQSVTHPHALKKFSVSLAGIALLAQASAQTLRPQSGIYPLGHDVQFRPAGLSFSAGPALPDGLLFANVLHSYAPTDICAAYGVDALHAEGWTGKGQTIIIVDSYGSPTALQDLQTFSATFGLPAPNLTIYYPDGQPTLNSSDKLSWSTETSIDLEWAHAIAPDASLVLIAVNKLSDSGDGGESAVLRGIQYAVSNYPPSPISMSFASAEQDFSSSTQPQQYEGVFQQAIAAGFTPLAAAGDWGTANGVKQSSGAQSANVWPYPTVCWPASSPSVTAVGGTWLQYHWQWDPQTNFAAFAAITDPHPFSDKDPAAMAYLNWDITDGQVEAPWREDHALVFAGGSGVAGGGGLSAVFPTPTWQLGLPQSLTQGARTTPDLSWNAAADGGVIIYASQAGGWANAYGTSCGTPQIAGVVALVNQMRASIGKGPIGHLAPRLYQLPASDFNDIVPQPFGSGANAITLQDNFRYGYTIPGLPTAVGYDLTTGLGSPRAYELAHDLTTMFP